MERQLLLTLRHAAHVRTFTFDPATASVVWLGPEGPGDGSADAWARLEGSSDGVTLRALGDNRLVVLGTGDEPSTDVLVGESPMMIGVRTVASGILAVAYVRPLEEGSAQFATYAIRENTTLHVGRGHESELRYGSEFVSVRHARLGFERGEFNVTDLQSGNGTSVNGELIAPLHPRRLKAGDIVQVLDLIIMVGRGIVCMNHPRGVDVRAHVLERLPHDDAASEPEAEDASLEPPLFYPAPRLSRTVVPVVIDVDAPPAMEDEDPQPVLMQIGPSFLMGMSSVFMGANAISSIAGGGSVLQSLPSLSMMVAMLGGTLIWPMVSRAYEKRTRLAEELRLGRKYAAYLDGIENRLLEASVEQSKVMAENLLPVRQLLAWAEESSPHLMSHARSHEDFLKLRVGIGDLTANAEVKWPDRGFSTNDDMLWERVEALRANPPLMHDVPLACDLVGHPVIGVLGERTATWEFVRGLLAQTCGRYTYREVKVVLFASESERSEWEPLTCTGHLHGEGDEGRLVALGFEGLTRLDHVLDSELDRRLGASASSGGACTPHFVVVCANDALCKQSHALGVLLRCNSSVGFSLLYLGRRLSDLPSECGYLVDLDKSVMRDWDLQRGESGRAACMFERADVSSTLQEFNPDIMITRSMARSFFLDMGRLRLGSSDEAFGLPDSLGFLEMFRVGNAAHLNVGQRWVESDPARTLATPVGVDERGQVVMLDLHEKAHGPHGLVAGTTGSGKSEFIISYILSLCVGYSPLEVAFVLIDYKGGGLAGAFENEFVRLPHLAGTITNLDGGEVRRALVSIRSELKRRQRLFAEARSVSGEATMDIQRYVTLCRQGVVDKPLPHLVIVADEFAELKEQEPQFMDELISAARIGRSLGIHLILATQKPTGVVNDQIWANARFKVALKVSDASDSKEMIRRDDAAHLSRPGSFYLLVGYDELFVGGQAAYAGMPYEMREGYEPSRDTAVELLDAEGVTIAAMRPPKRGVTTTDFDELHAVLEQVVLAAQAKGVSTQRLWLDPLPWRISLKQVDRVFGCAPEARLGCTVGMVDDPECQEQRRLDVDVSREGNVLLYGAPDSGVDELLRAMIVSMAGRRSEDDLWVYGWDGGSGTLLALEPLPQVGGIAMGSDEERTNNLLKMLQKELERRKREVARSAGASLPHIVLAIANLPSLLETSTGIGEFLASFTRDAPRRGIHVLATSSSTRGIPFRLQANFSSSVMLWMRDEDDYDGVMGSRVDVVPPHRDRRGIAREGKRILEVLGVSVGEHEEDDIKALGAQWDERMTWRVAPIPVLPARVTWREMGATKGNAAVPVGYSKEDVIACHADLEEFFSLLVVGNDRKATSSYLRACCEALGQSSSSFAAIDLFRGLGGLAGMRVAASVEEAHEVLASMAREESGLDVLIVTNVVQTLERLPQDDANYLMAYLTQGGEVVGPAVVLGAEAWQMASRYEGWARVAKSQGLGLWVGDGFADQSVLHYSSLSPEYRRHAGPTDGFLVRGTSVEAVRVLVPEGGDCR